MPSNIKLVKTNLSDVVVLEPQIFPDERGSFRETYNHQKLEGTLEKKLDLIPQINEAITSHGWVRGL